MAQRKTLTDRQVAKLKPGLKRITMPDPLLRGHYIRIAPSGAKSYVAVARDKDGKQRWATIGTVDHLTIAEAREAARKAMKRINGINAWQPTVEPPPVMPDSFEAVAENYLKRHVRAKGLRSRSEIERILETQVYPVWKDREFTSIRRGDVAALLDRLQDASGPSAADHALAIVRGLMNWYASRSDDYLCPIARGMRRTDPKSRKRARTLDDDELRTVWKIAESNGKFGAILRVAMLTAQRRRKIVTMRWEDVSVDGVWKIPAEDRENMSYASKYQGYLPIPVT